VRRRSTGSSIVSILTFFGIAGKEVCVDTEVDLHGTPSSLNIRRGETPLVVFI